MLFCLFIIILAIDWILSAGSGFKTTHDVKQMKSYIWQKNDLSENTCERYCYFANKATDVKQGFVKNNFGWLWKTW